MKQLNRSQCCELHFRHSREPHDMIRDHEKWNFLSYWDVATKATQLALFWQHIKTKQLCNLVAWISSYAMSFNSYTFWKTAYYTFNIKYCISDIEKLSSGHPKHFQKQNIVFQKCNLQHWHLTQNEEWLLDFRNKCSHNA